MRRLFCGKLIPVFLSVLMLPVSAFSVNAEEPITKNYDYYASLSDYEVYVEFCETFRKNPAETLPDETELPWYQRLAGRTLTGHVWCNEEWTAEDATDAKKQPELFGLPADWYGEEEHPVYWENEQVGVAVRQYNVAEMQKSGGFTTHDNVRYQGFVLRYNFENVSCYVPDFDINSTIDKYRVILPMWNAGIMKTYGIQDKTSAWYGIEFPEVVGPVSPYAYGDLNKDHEVNAADAALILQYAAAVGAGYTGSLENYIEGPSTNVDERVLRGTAYLEGSFNDLEAEDFYLSGDPIYENEEFSCTWDISGCENFDDADTIALRIEYAHPNPLGKSGEVALTVSEVWLDDVKIEELSGKPLYSCRTDHGFEMDDVTDITFNLRNSVFNDLDMEFSEQVTVIFLLTGLSEPEAE